MRRSLLSALCLLFSMAFLPAADEIPVPQDYQVPFFPPAGELEGLVITIDPGHGGSSFSPGYSGSAIGVNSRVVEGDLNMRVAGLLYHHLKDAGASVSITRRDDRKVVPGDSGRAEELGARTALAEQTRSHLFLSLHHNSVGRETAHGVVILIWPTDKAGNEQPLETAYADILREEVEMQVPHAERFPHYVIDHPLASGSDIPSAVVEFGFLTNPEFDAWVARQDAHNAEARGAYNAIARMWREHRAELEALRARLFPDAAAKPAEKPADDTPFPFGRPMRSTWAYDRPAATEAEARAIVAAYKNTQMTDRTTLILDATIERRDGAWVLGGTTNVPRLASGLASELRRALAAEIASEMRVLPGDSVGPEPFGVCAIPMAITWVEPREASGEQTQLLLGEPLFLLDRTEDSAYWRVQGIDGYAGWVRADAVKRLSRAEFADLMRARTARVVRNSMKGTFRIPPGARLVVSETGATSTTVLLPAGDSAEIPNGSLRLSDPTAGRVAAETALREFLHTPYVFGARSPQGLDCSGLVGSCWAVAGVQLPRDAHQQALVGQLVATRDFPDAMRPGDVLFFVDERGRVFHTGISLGGLRFIHASPPQVHISSLDPADPLYVSGWHEAFVLARRPGE